MKDYNNNYKPYNKSSFQNNEKLNPLEKVRVINIPLHEYYKDKEQLYMPITGISYIMAMNFNKIAPSQLRKILDESKKYTKELDSGADFEKVQSKIFSLLPLAAYNAGRMKELQPLFEFLYEHLNKNSIQNKQDIDVFDELFTSIIAYHKYLTKR